MKSIRNLITMGALIILSTICHGQDIEVQGHRGNRGLLPENTLPAFSAAIEGGADVLEFDVLTTQDGVLVIHHNFFLNPKLCTNQDGTPLADTPLVCNVPLSKIKQIDCGNKRDPEFPQQELIPATQIPTLEELFDLIKKSSHPNAKKVRLNLEIKRDPYHPDYTISPAEIAKKILDQVKQSGLSDRIYFSSFDPLVLSEIRKLDSECKLGFIFSHEGLLLAEQLNPEDPMGFIIKVASSLSIQILSPHHALLKDIKEIQTLHSAGFKIVPWTVNDLARCDELIKMGVDGIITDYPLALIQHLKTSE